MGSSSSRRVREGKGKAGEEARMGRQLESGVEDDPTTIQPGGSSE
jgi:hypothetical protein